MHLKGVSLSDTLSLSLSLISLTEVRERERRWGGVGGRRWEVAEDGDGGGVFRSRCWCRWFVGVQRIWISAPSLSIHP
ncbi:hypothetical protein Hdeb2414_s0053g00753441 [Helianthus debilis subsp. tardiflorus]